ncbi:MAG TPA: FUSC family protein [Terriglobales bacterium]|nr:FUSC family protein [Terriglobales bacterium]
MSPRQNWILSGFTPQWIIHAARTTVAAVVSLLAARLVHLPEAYWAAITTVVILQSTLGAALTVSAQRFIGTAIGAAFGALLAARFGSSVIAFGAGIFLMGLLCAALHLDRAAYRFAGITLAIVMLIAHPQSHWTIAIHRFLEVSIGIVVGLLLTALWPERSEILPAQSAT